MSLYLEEKNISDASTPLIKSSMKLSRSSREWASRSKKDQTSIAITTTSKDLISLQIIPQETCKIHFMSLRIVYCAHILLVPNYELWNATSRPFASLSLGNASATRQ